jgi:hypothetical protein
MAKRGRSASLDRMVSRLKELDKERKAILAGLTAAFSSLSGGESPFPWGKQPGRRGRPRRSADSGGAVGNARRADSGGAVGNGARQRKPMSQEARDKIAAAQKARWAAVKAGRKK